MVQEGHLAEEVASGEDRDQAVAAGLDVEIDAHPAAADEVHLVGRLGALLEEQLPRGQGPLAHAIEVIRDARPTEKAGGRRCNH